MRRIASAAAAKKCCRPFQSRSFAPEILSHLINGDFMTVVVIIPEGMTVHQIGERLQAAGLGCDSSFDQAAFNGLLTRTLGLDALGVEGFLFPATYHFSPFVTSDQILAAMLARISAERGSSSKPFRAT